MTHSNPSDHFAPQPDPSGKDRRYVLRGLFTLGAAFGSLPLLGNSLLLRTPSAPWGPNGECPTTLTKSNSKVYTITGSVPATFTASGVGTPPSSGGNTETYTGLNETGVTNSNTLVWPGPGPGGTQPVTVARSFTISSAPSGGQTITYSWNGKSFTQTISRHPTAWSLTYTINESVSYTSTTPCDKDEDGDGGAPEPIEIPSSGDAATLETIDARGADIFEPHSRSEWARRLSLAACGAGRSARGQLVLN